LSREFTFKLGGYLAMDYSHITIPFKNKIFKVVNELALGFLTKKLPQVILISE